MTIAQRRLGETHWARTRLPSQLGWDSHNYVTMALDASGRLHVVGNLHASPLVYFRSREPRNAATLERQPAMTGQRESQMTYPVFFRDRQGRLLFRYRDGRSGNGDDVYNMWDDETGQWRRWLDTPLISGGGRRNAYASLPTIGPDNRFHMIWVWREWPDCASNHSLSYARSDDLRQWTDSGGRPLPLPMTLETCEVVDPVPPGGGLLNGNARLGFDRAGRPVITYHKYDARGDLQIYAARRDDDRWRIVQVSEWTGYRWEFRGRGTIVKEVVISAAEPGPPGRLLLPYHYGRGRGVWVLDEATLRPCPSETAPRRPAIGLPAAARRVESGFPGMQKRHAWDVGTPPAGSAYPRFCS